MARPLCVLRIIVRSAHIRCAGGWEPRWRKYDAAWRRVVLEEVAAGRKLQPAAPRVGKQLRLHPARATRLVEALQVEVAWRRAVEAGERPEAAARRLGIGEDRLRLLLGTVAA